MKQGKMRPQTFIRKYHRDSQCIPSERQVFNYLQSKNCNRTIQSLKRQLVQLHKKQETIQDILKQFKISNKSIEIKYFIQKLIEKYPKINKKIQFFLFVWAITLTQVNNTKKQRIIQLKQYIDDYGQDLSQYPQILPYFALPYLQDLQTHPFLKTIYTKQWQQKLFKMVDITYPLNNSNFQHQLQNFIEKPSNQFSNSIQYKIINDLLQICSTLEDYIPYKNSQIQILFQRVHRYQNTLKKQGPLHETSEIQLSGEFHKGQYIQSQETQTINHLEKLLKDNNTNFRQKMNELEANWKHQYEFNWKKIKSDFHQSMVNQSFKNNELINILRQQLTFNHGNIRKFLLQQIIINDFLLLQDNSINNFLAALGGTNETLIITLLKFISKISQFYHGRTYLSESKPLLLTMLTILKSSLQSQNSSKRSVYVNQQRIYKHIWCILYKLSARDNATQFLISHDVLKILQKFFKNKRQIDMHTKIYCSALLMNLMLKPNGRKECLKTEIFHEVIQLIIQSNDENQQQQELQLQQFINATLYSFMFESKFKQKAKQINLKQILMKKAKTRNEEHYSRQIDYIIQVIDGKILEQESSDEKNDKEDNQQGTDWDISEDEDSFKLHQAQFFSKNKYSDVLSKYKLVKQQRNRRHLKPAVKSSKQKRETRSKQAKQIKQNLFEKMPYNKDMYNSEILNNFQYKKQNYSWKAKSKKNKP